MPTPENPIIQDHETEFKVPKNLENEIRAIEVNAKANIQADKSGQAVISSMPAQSAKIQIPADNSSLIQKAKGSVSDAATWLAMFLLRMIAKKDANNN